MQCGENGKIGRAPSKCSPQGARRNTGAHKTDGSHLISFVRKRQETHILTGSGSPRSVRAHVAVKRSDRTMHARSHAGAHTRPAPANRNCPMAAMPSPGFSAPGSIPGRRLAGPGSGGTEPSSAFRIPSTWPESQPWRSDSFVRERGVRPAQQHAWPYRLCNA